MVDRSPLASLRTNSRYAGLDPTRLHPAHKRALVDLCSHDPPVDYWRPAKITARRMACAEALHGAGLIHRAILPPRRARYVKDRPVCWPTEEGKRWAEYFRTTLPYDPVLEAERDRGTVTT